MNPCSTDKKYPRAIIKHAQERCCQEKENVEFLIQHKIDMLARVREIIDVFDNEVGRAPLRIGNNIILPSPVEMFEEEARYHGASLDYQEDRLNELNEAEKSIDNALRRHRQNYDYKFEKFVNTYRQKPKNNSASSSSHV